MVSTVAGTGAFGVTDGKLKQAAFAYTAGVALDSDGRIYTVDAGGHTIRVLKP